MTGRKIMIAAAGNLKKISLELGGKSPNIIFDDVDLDLAVEAAMVGIFAGQGEVCSAGSRLVLQRSMADRLLPAWRRPAEKSWWGMAWMRTPKWVR